MKTLPWLNPTRAGLLSKALQERILIIDGAMGTMIQRHGLQEADYRGERFAEGCDTQHAHEHGAGCGHAHRIAEQDCWKARTCSPPRAPI